MSLKNVLIIVNDIDKSIDFYEELFGLRVITRQEGNVIIVRFYDPSGNLIEVRTPINYN